VWQNPKTILRRFFPWKKKKKSIPWLSMKQVDTAAKYLDLNPGLIEKVKQTREN